MTKTYVKQGQNKPYMKLSGEPAKTHMTNVQTEQKKEWYPPKETKTPKMEENKDGLIAVAQTSDDLGMDTPEKPSLPNIVHSAIPKATEGSITVVEGAVGGTPNAIQTSEVAPIPDVDASGAENVGEHPALNIDEALENSGSNK